MKQVWRRFVLMLAGFCRFLGEALCDLVDDDLPAVPAGDDQPEGRGRGCGR